MKNKWLFIAALSGFFCIAFGAFAAHGLEKNLTPKALAWIETGLKYQFFHTVALMVLGTLQLYLKADIDRVINWIGSTWSLGIVLFSGSLYALALGATKSVAWLTPIGGTLFLIGWAMLAYRSYKNKS
ncbi:TPA: DUF423 domain-containing protein [Pasteurella multocida]|uniref:DUF423 domain-containing protein n=1 Tax=Pasteurella multocida TaxID=747 RepID=UPI00027B1F31|nr:DUF423 domain-containing protein [Pasteurella multocida]EJS88918.1 hypothetical protein AAUPMB_08204 [Pasteurella multocida subsp. multocida str. Anand1_buffalo]APB80291.1 hypothetical protein BMF22_09780 [Pasteurella multocida]EJS84898.1 hypothetical protein KCU_04121 [Pasteurella multocida subsp. multocida str. P52VAC]EPE74960.1 membrane protein [Pasteurella multocida 1500C]ERL41978.1 membrane protein [Pasteurella multocida subsp. multocida str. PMTB]